MPLRVVPVLWSTHVRRYECDRNLHLNNVVYLEYLEEASADAWSGLIDAEWIVRKLSIEYRAPAFRGDRLLISGWPLGNAGERGELLRCGYAIRKNSEAEPILRAELQFELHSAKTGELVMLPEGWPSVERAEADRIRPDRRAGEPREGHWFLFEHTVRSHELDTAGRMSAADLLRGVEDARLCACADAGWTESRFVDADFLTVQIRHEAEFMLSARLSDRLRIRSRVCELGRLRGTWEHLIERDGVLVARDLSTGAFLNRTGVPSQPPEPIMSDLLAGPSGYTLSPK
ncbi:acyl-CoA thioesterase [Salinispira pacifica]